MAIQGIIRPPPDIRVVADRTAMFVAKNGRAFETRILGSAKGKTPKFAFLQTESPFHAYYEDRIKHFESGEGDEKKTAEEEAKKKADGSDDSQKEAAKEKAVSESAAKAPAKENVTKQKASIMDPVAKVIMGQRSVIANHLKKEKEKRRKAADAAASVKTGPDDENGQGRNGTEQRPASDIGEKMLPLPAPPMPLDTVQVVAPYYLTPTQIETIQLVAQFVAMDGKGGPFLPALVNREWSNPDFGFCQPRNIHFSYFSALVDAYRKILSDFVEAADSSTNNAVTTTPVEVAASLDSNKPTTAIKIEEGVQAEAPTEPPKPVYDVQAALNDAAYRTEYERELKRRRRKHQENSNAALEDGEIANAIDWHDFVVVETIDFPIEEEVDVGVSMLPTKTANTTATTPNTVASANVSGAAGGDAATVGNGDMKMEESSDEEDDDTDNIRVVPSYTPKVVGTYDPSTARVVDPITGKSVAVADMPEHMRIQLLDPKWAEERKKFQDKQKDSNLVGGDAVVANIARMSQTAAATAPSTALGASTTNTSGSAGHSRPASYAVGAPTVAIAPVVGPAEGRGDHRRMGQQQQQQQYGGFRGPPSSGAGSTETDQPPSKRQRTAPVLPPPLLQQQQKHKVTIAPPLVINPQSVNNNDGLMVDDPTKSAINDPMQSATDAPPAVAPPAEEEKELLPAEEFIASLGENPLVELQVRLPNDATSQNWNFFGQTLTLVGIDPKSSIRDIKVVLSKQHLNDMPVNKIQLKISTSSTDAKGKFLNNNATLAALNIGPNAELELKTKQRGGRK